MDHGPHWYTRLVNQPWIMRPIQIDLVIVIDQPWENISFHAYGSGAYWKSHKRRSSCLLHYRIWAKNMWESSTKGERYFATTNSFHSRSFGPSIIYHRGCKSWSKYIQCKCTQQSWRNSNIPFYVIDKFLLFCQPLLEVLCFVSKLVFIMVYSFFLLITIMPYIPRECKHCVHATLDIQLHLQSVAMKTKLLSFLVQTLCGWKSATCTYVKVSTNLWRTSTDFCRRMPDLKGRVVQLRVLLNMIKLTSTDREDLASLNDMKDILAKSLQYQEQREKACRAAFW